MRLFRTRAFSTEEQRLAGVACGVALASLMPVALYQTGRIRHLPEYPLEVFASERIVLSDMAHPFGMPDGLIGLGVYGVAMALVLGARSNETVRRLLGVKLALLGAGAAFNTVREVVQFRKLCSYCTNVALATGVMVWAGRRVIQKTAKEMAAQWPELG